MNDSLAYHQSQAFRGLVALILAYSIWSLGVVLFKLLGNVPSLDIVAHRAVWSFVFLLPIIIFTNRWHSCYVALTTPKLLGGLAVTSLLISINWLVFVWSIETDRVVQSSLGYYINPLISVLLGVVVLSERLRMAQMVSLLLATISVGAMLWLLGIIPWISVTLAVSFAFYGLFRKMIAVDHLDGLFIETILLLPIALGWLLLRSSAPEMTGLPPVDIGLREWALLALGGPSTAIPLLLFAYGIRRRSLTVVGFTQYINPTMQLLLAVLVYGELFGGLHLLIFSGIWLALAIFLLDLIRHEKERAREIEGS
ncbi:MAG: EamA family transporter RarD [Hyphomicrobiales bacterium]|nr:EamA family transporter RarD [Hyphomicrobiales bacterium]MCY4032474.1 EamA family transporter RarD [Hyphomicrobiales bacterium]MCY4038818.1 EamA family transporter RarD [Hyphomicrobiales bacterium]